MTTSKLPLPLGFRVTLDPGTIELAEGLLFGGSPARVLRLTPAGRRAWQELVDGPVASPAGGVLARRLTDAGLAHPSPPESVRVSADVTVIIPVHERPMLLDRCLTALAGHHPVLVVDDGSYAAVADITEVARRHGAKLVRRPVNGGPGAARDTGLEHATSEFVAFLDSDCLPHPGWTDELAWHFADPLVAAVAPRITALAAESSSGSYTRANGSLDLGDQQARVAPNTRVSYVPTAALVARRAALLDVARQSLVFDPAMRVGEDVDLIWRLHESGWRIRYDPGVTIDHHEPATWRGLLSRRFRYGTSAAALATRHPTSVPPLVLHPWPALTVAALLARRPLVAATAFGASNLAMIQTLRKADVPVKGVPTALLKAVHQTWLGTGRYSTQLAAPLLLGLLAAKGRNSTGRRLAVASLLLGPPLTAWAERRPALDPVRYTLATLADDLAYGAGVWTGCLTHRTTIPVRPVIARRSLRIDPPKT